MTCMVRSVRAVAIALALMLAVAAPVAAGGEARRSGPCSGGPGEWELRAGREDGGRIRVRFRIDHVHEGQRWQLFLSDNGARFYSGAKTARRGGEVRVQVRTRDRSGRDRIAASGVNTRTGATCQGSVRY